MKLFFLIFTLVVVPFTVWAQGSGCEDYLPGEDRVDCHPDPGAGEDACRARNCTWCPTDGPNIPFCYNSPPSNNFGRYVMEGQPIPLPNGVRVNLVRVEPPKSVRRWEGEAETLTLVAEFQSNSRLHVKISDSNPRWEVPLEILPPSEGNTNPLYELEFENDPYFNFRVVRKATRAILLAAGGNRGNFIFADQYITLSWSPATDRVYGIGENEQHTFKHDFEKSLTWGLWAKDQYPTHTANMYGVQPYYTVLEADGKAHSVAIVNSNAQEFTMLPGPLIKYTTIGGLLDFYMFFGPTPEDTVQQYTEAVGRAPLPPYWALGFQLCKFGYDNIENMKAAVDRTAQYNIPHDVQYGDIDIMHNQLDFTYSMDRFAGLPDYIRELKSRGIKFMTILDPHISIVQPTGTYRPFDYGQEMDVWVKRANGSNAVGKVWPNNGNDPVYFPDYSLQRAREWWINLIQEFHDLLEYDGLWIDMNEPANFVFGDLEGCEVNKLNSPPYVPSIEGRSLLTMTLCADNVHAAGSHYNTHSIFGWFQSEPTLRGTRLGTGKRGLILSRSTFLGSGRWTAHWLGDNWSRWSNLHYSIIGMLQFNQFGIPFVGADICGFLENTTPEMCQRWMELGAFYPFARNHNVAGAMIQDPGSFGPEIAESSRKALMIRYTLLPYLYTLFFQHYTTGGTVARALWHEFPNDEVATGIDRQFLWGPGFMISPVLDQGSLEVQAYFPDARFYDYYGGGEMLAKAEWVTIAAPLDFIPLHVRGGHILPTQEPAVTTQIARENPLGFIVALDEFNSAGGSLYYDDGDSIEPVESGNYFNAIYSAANRVFRSSIVRNTYQGMSNKTIGSVRLLGAGTVTSVTVNGVPHTDFIQTPTGEVLIGNLGLRATEEFVIRY